MDHVITFGALAGSLTQAERSGGDYQTGAWLTAICAVADVLPTLLGPTNAGII